MHIATFGSKPLDQWLLATAATDSRDELGFSEALGGRCSYGNEL